MKRKLIKFLMSPFKEEIEQIVQETKIKSIHENMEIMASGIEVINKAFESCINIAEDVQAKKLEVSQMLVQTKKIEVLLREMYYNMEERLTEGKETPSFDLISNESINAMKEFFSNDDNIRHYYNRPIVKMRPFKEGSNEAVFDVYLSHDEQKKSRQDIKEIIDSHFVSTQWDFMEDLDKDYKEGSLIWALVQIKNGETVNIVGHQNQVIYKGYRDNIYINKSCGIMPIVFYKLLLFQNDLAFEIYSEGENDDVEGLNNG